MLGTQTIRQDFDRVLLAFIEGARHGISSRQWFYFVEGEVYLRVLPTGASLTIYIGNVKLKKNYQNQGLFKMMCRVIRSRILRSAQGIGRLYVENVQNAALEEHLRKQQFVCATPTEMCPTFFKVIQHANPE